jgi:hypothetical protein
MKIYSLNKKIKLYALPVISLEGIKAIPITIVNEQQTKNFINEYVINNQPLFYVDPNIKFEDCNELLDKIKNCFTRKRKL